MLLHCNLNCFPEILDPVDGQTFRNIKLIRAIAGNDTFCKAKSGNLGKPLVHIGNTANLSCQSNFANGGKIIRNGAVPIGGCHSQSNRKIRRRLVQTQTTNNIDIGVKQI